MDIQIIDLKLTLSDERGLVSVTDSSLAENTVSSLSHYPVWKQVPLSQRK